MSMQLNDPAALPSPVSRPTPVQCHAERRVTPRVELPFPAVVRGVDRNGERFRLETVLDNFSATGLCMHAARPIEPGTTLFVVVRLSTAPAREVAAPSVAARARVVWAVPRPGGEWSIGVAFTRQRFLYAATA